MIDLVEPEVQNLGYQLWDILWVPTGRILRMYISHPDWSEAISIEDCQRVSRRVDGLIESSEILQDRYYLEVSSLGETPFIRTLIQLSHFRDRTLEFTDLNGKKVSGVLKQVANDGSIVWSRPTGATGGEAPEEVHGQISDYQRIRAKKE